jgi:glycine reductase
MLKNKKVFIIGERDGVPAPAVAECVKAAGGEIIFMDTQCFV